ncbi:MAG: hypothetical protein Q8P67_06460 [archaeon]|nr:hypothetical protein [archaeon]
MPKSGDTTSGPRSNRAPPMMSPGFAPSRGRGTALPLLAASPPGLMTPHLSLTSTPLDEIKGRGSIFRLVPNPPSSPSPSPSPASSPSSSASASLFLPLFFSLSLETIAIAVIADFADGTPLFC